MLNTKSSIIATVANEMKLTYWREYYGLDGVFYENASSALSSVGEYARYFTVIFEHENDTKTSYIEMNKLTLFNAPLKVLITYPPKNKKATGNIIEKYSEIVQEADVPNSQRHMVIFGIRNNEKIEWENYLYENGKFNLERK
jgi:hypothetical protein